MLECKHKQLTYRQWQQEIGIPRMEEHRKKKAEWDAYRRERMRKAREGEELTDANCVVCGKVLTGGRTRTCGKECQERLQYAHGRMSRDISGKLSMADFGIKQARCIVCGGKIPRGIHGLTCSDECQYIMQDKKGYSY